MRSGRERGEVFAWRYFFMLALECVYGADTRSDDQPQAHHPNWKLIISDELSTQRAFLTLLTTTDPLCQLHRAGYDLSVACDRRLLFCHRMCSQVA